MFIRVLSLFSSLKPTASSPHRMKPERMIHKNVFLKSPQQSPGVASEWYLANGTAVSNKSQICLWSMLFNFLSQQYLSIHLQFVWHRHRRLVTSKRSKRSHGEMSGGLKWCVLVCLKFYRRETNLIQRENATSDDLSNYSDQSKVSIQHPSHAEPFSFLYHSISQSNTRSVHGIDYIQFGHTFNQLGRY